MLTLCPALIKAAPRGAHPVAPCGHTAVAVTGGRGGLKWKEGAQSSVLSLDDAMCCCTPTFSIICTLIVHCRGVLSSLGAALGWGEVVTAVSVGAVCDVITSERDK